jgi:2-polyprenyl-3-methyl-5-hydroxy-6-metoxy-1,4-benzoquinol methylase
MAKDRDKKSKKDQRDRRETNATVLKKAMLERLPRRLSGSAQIAFSAAPSLLEHYVQSLHVVFAQHGRVFTEEETEHLRGILDKKLKEGFAASPYARVIVNFETDPPPKTSLSYRIATHISTVANEYDNWIKTRQPPYFGTHPDAKIVSTARSLGAPKDVPVLDIGAGTGRNTLPLAREGFPIDAIELAPALVKILREDVEKEQLSARVFEGDALAGAVELPERHYKLVFLAEVIASHIRSVEQLRTLFQGAAETLASGGMLLFNAFIAVDGYKPDALVKELSQVFWMNAFTHGEIATAMQALPFELVSDESTHDYELEHQPKDGWPPTGWFVDWAKGNDMFDLASGRSPLELRWLCYRRK